MIIKNGVKEIYTNPNGNFAFCTDFKDNLFGWGNNNDGQLSLDNSHAYLHVLKNAPSCRTLYYPGPTSIPYVNNLQEDSCDYRLKLGCK